MLCSCSCSCEHEQRLELLVQSADRWHSARGAYKRTTVRRHSRPAFPLLPKAYKRGSNCFLATSYLDDIVHDVASRPTSANADSRSDGVAHDSTEAESASPVTGCRDGEMSRIVM